MTAQLTVLFACAALTAAFASEKNVKLQDLPPAVQQTVKAETANATLVGLTMETENGKTEYEAETKIGGRGRDVEIDSSGAIVSVEEEVALDTLPPAAKAAIEKRAAGAKITKVEKVTKGSAVSYEAAIKRGLKTAEITVNPDGSPVK